MILLFVSLQTMSKPIKKIIVKTNDEKTAEVNAVFDTGSFYTIIRQDRIPAGSAILPRLNTQQFRTAGQGGKLNVIGDISLTLTIGDKMIQDSAFVSPDLVSDMLIGAKTMQAWDISIQNKNGHTEIHIGYDMRDPEITEVD